MLNAYTCNKARISILAQEITWSNLANLITKCRLQLQQPLAVTSFCMCVSLCACVAIDPSISPIPSRCWNNFLARHPKLVGWLLQILNNECLVLASEGLDTAASVPFSLALQWPVRWCRKKRRFCGPFRHLQAMYSNTHIFSKHLQCLHVMITCYEKWGPYPQPCWACCEVFLLNSHSEPSAASRNSEMLAWQQMRP